jgi:hypothetical protein
MAGIKDLKLGKDVIAEGSLDDLPEQIGSRKRALQPGPYRFKFPVKAKISECFDTFETQIGGKPVIRVVAILRDEAALTVIQAPAKWEDRVGEAWGTRISNAERKRGKGEDAPVASDMDYVLAVVSPKGTAKPSTNRAYLEAFEARCPEQEFGADVEWNWRCDDKRNVRVPDPDNEGKTIELDGEEGRESRKGCGTKYYQKDVDKVDKDGNADTAGEYPRTIECQCGAILFANENLQNFRK